MKAARILSPSMSFPMFVKVREVRAPFASICRRAAAVFSPACVLLAVLAFAFASIASAQTAHFFMSESILPTPTPLQYPSGVAVDTKGNIYIADQSNDRVVKETPSEGGFIETSISTGAGSPYGVAVDQSGNVYIACDNLSYLIKETLTPTGYTESTFGGNLFSPTSLAVDSTGKVYVTAYSELLVETPSGGSYVQSGISVADSRGFNAVAVDANFNLYVTGGDLNYLGHLWKLTLNNDGYSAVSLATNPSGFGGVALDGAGNIYVADGSYSDILVFSPSGGGYNEGALPQESFYFGVRFMQSVAVDASGDVFFIDYFNNLLGEYSPAAGNSGPAPVYSPSANVVSEFFTIDTAPATGSEAVTTQGSTSPLLDFSDSGYGSCAQGNWSAGEICSVDVVFTPAATGARYGSAVLYDASNNVIATGYVEGIGVAPQVNFSPGTPVSQNILSYGSAVAVDANGILYTVAPGSATAFKDVPSGGPSNWIETTIGSGLGSATGIAIDGSGDLYIADQQNQQIVKETLTASGYAQSVIANKSNGLSAPSAVAVDANGNVYVTDTGTNLVYKETLLAGIYTQSVVPTSTLNQPSGVAVDAIGDVYIADTNNNRVLMETLTENTYTESQIGTGLSAPYGVALDAQGNVYISETAAQVVYKETLAVGSYTQSTISSGIYPFGIALDANFNLYVAGSFKQLLVKVNVSDGIVVNFDSTDVGSVSADSPETITLINAGNAPLILPIVSGESNPNVGGEFSLNSGGALACTLVTSSSSASYTLAAGASCQLPISFSPTSGGFTQSNATIWDNNLNLGAPNYAAQSLLLQGSGVQVQSQTINFPAIANQVAATMLPLSASASSGLTVSFASLTPSICMATGSTASLNAAGTCTIQASQGGDAQYSPAPNVNQSFKVSLAAQTINFPAIAAQTAGTMLNLSATASSGLTVSFASVTPSVCTVSVSTASLNDYGTCIIQATQTGSTAYSAAHYENQSFLVQHETQTITFPVITTQTAGTTLPLNASASSGLTVNLVSLTPSVCTVSVSTASLNAYGTCIIQATQGGNNVYSPAQYVDRGFLVQHETQTIDFPAIAAQTVETMLPLSASASSGLTVSFATLTPSICSVSGSTASLNGGGTCIIEATQAGNTVYSAAHYVEQSFLVQYLAQTVNFPAIAAQTAGTMLNLSATASSGLTVNFASVTPSVCTVSVSTASLNAYGTCIIQATQAGNTVYSAAHFASQGFLVQHEAQTINFPAIAAQTAGTMLNLSASASSGLTVNFASVTPSVCTVSVSTASLNAYGTCIIQATQAGNNVYGAAHYVNQGFLVQHETQTINFPAIAAQTAGTMLNLSATASSGQAVSFGSQTPTICSVSSTTASMLKAGTCTIVATQSGNGVYGAAAPVLRSFTVKP